MVLGSKRRGSIPRIVPPDERSFMNDFERVEPDSCQKESMSDIRCDNSSWSWVVRSSLLCVKVHRQAEACDPERTCKICLHCRGRVLETESLNGARQTVSFLVDAWHPEQPEPPQFPLSFPVDPDPGGVEELAEFFLRTDMVELLSSSRILRALARSAHAWRFALCKHWRVTHNDPGCMVDMLKRGRVADEFLSLVDGSVLLTCLASDHQTDVTAMIVLRRVQPVACTRAVDWHASAVDEHAVSGFSKVPVNKEQFARLHRNGAFFALSVSNEHGLLLDGVGTRSRRVILPCDVGCSDIHMAVASLVGGNLASPCEPSVISLPFGCLHSEPCLGACHPAEFLVPHRIVLKEHALCLQPLTDEPSRPAHHSCSIDEVASSDVDLDPARINHHRLRNLFPLLVARLTHGADPVAASLREAQARRVSQEWTLESFETGGNLSSLGLSILVALGLSECCGARVRVFVGDAHSAVVGYWSQDAFVLCDPTKTTVNSFAISRNELIGGALEDIFYLPTRESIIEVLAVQVWHVARVLHVIPYMNAARIEFLKTGRRTTIGLHTHAWRPLAHHGRSDSETVLRQLLRRSKEWHADQNSSIVRPE